MENDDKDQKGDSDDSDDDGDSVNDNNDSSFCRRTDFSCTVFAHDCIKNSITRKEQRHVFLEHKMLNVLCIQELLSCAR